MARADTYTLLSLDRYAKIMGINPIQFNSADVAGLDVFPAYGCDSIWFQYPWQRSDMVSRDHLARTIHIAEKEIADKVGFWPAPVWTEEEVHNYPKPFPRDKYGRGVDVRGAIKGIHANYSKYISGGRRNTIEVGEATHVGGELVYSDDDGDNFYETATITLAIPDAVPDNPDVCKFKVYFDGYSDPEWEIKYPRNAEVTGGNIVLEFDSWLFIDPGHWEAYPTDEGPQAIDISETNLPAAVTNLVDTVDVVYEYNDFSQASAQFIWESGSSLSCDICGGVGCEACSFITQNGCAKASSIKDGFIRPTPATYDEEDEEWDVTTLEESIEPDMIKIWYYSGEESQEFIKGKSCDPLSYFWAETIAILATARLKRVIADCPGVKNTVEYWQKDLIQIPGGGGGGYFQKDEIEESPFGTRMGEVEVWRRIKNFVPDKKVGFAVI